MKPAGQGIVVNTADAATSTVVGGAMAFVESAVSGLVLGGLVGLVTNVVSKGGRRSSRRRR
jgi:hypothetical protein